MDNDLHPIVAQMKPSAEQVPAILARGSDVAVTAGAGTGKTRTLVARYLALLAEGVPLRAVVAITFTRKAAREMRNRVREAVRAYLDTPGLDAAEGERWQGLYSGLDAARIGTIHSLCAEILRHHPAEAAIDPRFDMFDEGQMALLQAQVADEALTWAADDPLTVTLFALLGESDLRQLASTFLQHRLQLGAMWGDDVQEPEEPLERWERALAAARDSAWDAFLGDATFCEAVGVLEHCEPLDPNDRMAQQRDLALEAMSCQNAPREEAFSALAGINLSGGRQAAWAGGKDELAEVKGALKALRELWRAQAPMLTLSLNKADAQVAAHYPALRAFYEWTSQRYEARKAERRALDFDDLEAKALALLRDDPAVRAYWQTEIESLLVDEFQDTNARQGALLELLNGEGGRLFIVGDGKQSIYRFRGADVTVFREVWSKIGERGACHSLETSYRAHHALIEILNALLKPVLGEVEDPGRPFVEPFAPLVPHRQAAIAGVQAPFLELHLAQGSKKGGALNRAAQALASRLVALVEGDDASTLCGADTGRGNGGGLGYGDIAILCRATSSFAAYEDALEAAGIPFITVAGRGFYDRPEVRDVLNALQAIDDPTDDLALAGLLRSPVCGLSDMALYRLREAQRHDGASSLWAWLTDSDLAAIEEERPEMRAACTLIDELHGLAGRVPVADVLKAFLDATGYRAALLRAGQARGSRNLAKLLADAYASEMVAIGAFVEYVQQLRDVGTREGEARTISEGAVQLLTVHAAKGLEFPVVVIGEVSWGGGDRREPLITPDLGLVLPIKQDEELPASHCLAHQGELDQEDAEGDRLLYVAATRAQELLIISGLPAARKGSCWARLANVLGIEAVEPDGEPMRIVGRDLAGQPMACYFYAEEYSGAPDRAYRPGPEPMPLPEELPLLAMLPVARRPDDAILEAAVDPPRRVWRVVPRQRHARAPAWVVGQLVHGALALWYFPDDARGRDLHSWADAQAHGYGITAETERDDAVRRAARLLRRFQDTPLYAEMAAARRRYHEVPYSLTTTQGMESSVIDALYETAKGWVVVDFKTDDIRDEEALIGMLTQEGYVNQVRRYQSAAERLLGVRPRAGLCLLNYAGTVRWVDCE